MPGIKKHKSPAAIRQPQAFTLVELLVVITIIAILLAMLTPALDRALYQAELAVCATRLRGLGTVITTYAAENRRKYPYRAERVRGDYGSAPNVREPLTDDRGLFKSLFPEEVTLFCPMATLPKGVSIHDNTPDSVNIYTGHDMWFGGPMARDQPASKMFAMGDRPVCNGTTFDILASDFFRVWDGTTTQTVHADRRDANA